MRKQLNIRCEEQLIRQLKIIAAHKNISLNEMARLTLSKEVEFQRSDEAVNQALKAARV